MDIFTCPPELLKGEIEKRLGDGDSGIKLVCFDFFDTLITRSVIPEHTKELAANQLASLLVDQVDGDLIYRLRRVIEKKLCEESVAKGLDPEFKITDLAIRLYDVLNSGIIDLSRFAIRDQFVEQFIDIELAVEKTAQYVATQVFDSLKACRHAGTKIAIVSDFYLPERYFSRLLEFHDIAPHVDYLYVSADHLITKGSRGALYTLLMSNTGYGPDEILMVGDNLRADGEMALGLGITPICLELARHGNGGIRGKQDSIERYEQVLKSSGAGVFPELGISLHCFIDKLFQQAYRDNRKDLFFCSKEGEFLKKLFDQYQQIRFGRKVIKTHYLLVSRKATFICSLDELEKESFDRLFFHYRDMSTEEFLKSLNFPDSQVLEICREEIIDPGKFYQNFKDQENFKKLQGSHIFKTRYEQHRKNQKENFLSYLKSFQVDVNRYGLALVDVGWKGSIQNNIYYALGCDVEVTGYYIGLITPTELHKKNIKRGVLFSDYPQPTEYIHVFNNNRSLFEMVLGATHGSADGYFTQIQFNQLGEQSHRKLFEPFDEKNLVCPAVLDLPEERKLYDQHIKPLQDCMEKMNRLLSEEHILENPGRPPFRWFAEKHARAVFKPLAQEVELYAALYHLENFGMFGFTNFETKEKLSLRERVGNFIKLRKDPAAYLETGVWPPIILRRLGLGFLSRVDGQRRYKRIFG